MELNREQIIQVLEYCTGIKNVDACANCPACLGCNDCVDLLREESLALIKELTDSEDYWKRQTFDACMDKGRMDDKIKELTEENERLSHHCDDCAGCTQWKCDCSNIRDEAITEFAEKLQYTLCINNEDNTEYFDYAYTLETIDQIAKELLEEK